MALQANKGFDMKSEEDGLLPEEGSLGITNKRPRMTAQTSLERTTLVAVAYKDLSAHPFGVQWLQPPHPWVQLSQMSHNNPWVMGGAFGSMSYKNFRM